MYLLVYALLTTTELANVMTEYASTRVLPTPRADVAEVWRDLKNP